MCCEICDYWFHTRCEKVPDQMVREGRAREENNYTGTAISAKELGFHKLCKQMKTMEKIEQTYSQILTDDVLEEAYSACDSSSLFSTIYYCFPWPWLAHHMSLQ